MGKNILAVAIVAVSIVASSYILATSIKYYTDGRRYDAISSENRPIAYIVDRKEGRIIACNVSGGKTAVFSFQSPAQALGLLRSSALTPAPTLTAPPVLDWSKAEYLGPLEDKPAQGGVKLTPVDYDPFAESGPQKDKPAQTPTHTQDVPKSSSRAPKK